MAQSLIGLLKTAYSKPQTLFHICKKAKTVFLTALYRAKKIYPLLLQGYLLHNENVVSYLFFDFTAFYSAQ
jgi:hypothetical protein